jgi:hypothetical protein
MIDGDGRPQHDPHECRSCTARILWVQVLGADGQLKRKPGGKVQVMPVDYEPHPEGRVVVYDRDGSLVGRVLGRDEEPKIGEKTRRAHHITCVHAADWRAASRARRAS